MEVVRRNSTTAWVLWGFLTIQMIAGAVNVLLLAPVWMQLVHLLLADTIWLLIVLVIAEEGQGRSIQPASSPAVL
jgi:cytochrome c oxidase assembly protein subunit 15